MRFFIIGIIILSIFESHLLTAQQDKNNLVDNTSYENNIAVDQINFTVDFKIDFKKCIFRELHSERVLNLSQNLSTSSNILIEKGEILETYDYYKNDNLYIIYYKKTWGFIEADAFEKNSASNNALNNSYQPPKLLSKNPEKHLKLIFPDHTSGELLLNIRLTNTGAVKDITVLKSIPEIDESVIDTLKKLRFKPAKRNGRPVEAQFKLPLKYTSED